jgi:hypothetical protein
VAHHTKSWCGTQSLHLTNPLSAKVNSRSMSGKCQANLLKNAGSRKSTSKSETTAPTTLTFLQALHNKFLCFYSKCAKHRACSICWHYTGLCAELWIIFLGETGNLSKFFVCQGDSGTQRNKGYSFIWNIFHCGDLTKKMKNNF